MKFQKATKQQRWRRSRYAAHHVEARLLGTVEGDPETGCWNWAGTLMANGYGQVSAWGQKWLAHRLALHLEAVTQEERHRWSTWKPDGDVFGCKDCGSGLMQARLRNLRRQGAAVTQCPRNHEYTPENTYRAPGSNERRCRQCTRERVSA